MVWNAQNINKLFVYFVYYIFYIHIRHCVIGDHKPRTYLSIIHIRYCVIDDHSVYSFFHLMKWNDFAEMLKIIIKTTKIWIKRQIRFETISRNPFIFPTSLSPLPIYLYPPIYICSIFHTILCKYLGHLSPLSIYLSCLICPLISHLISIIFIINIHISISTLILIYPWPHMFYIYCRLCNYLGNISSIYLSSHIYLSLISSSYPLVWIYLLIDWLDVLMY